MHIITRKRLNEFAEKHLTAESGLAHWYRTLKQNNPANFAELRRLLPHADQVGGLTVFNIGGNKARLIAAIHYNRRKVYIRAVLSPESVYSHGADPRRIRRGQMEKIICQPHN